MNQNSNLVTVNPSVRQSTALETSEFKPASTFEFYTVNTNHSNVHSPLNKNLNLHTENAKTCQASPRRAVQKAKSSVKIYLRPKSRYRQPD